MAALIAIDLSDLVEATLAGESKCLDKSGPNVLPCLLDRAVLPLEVPPGILALPPEDHVLERAAALDAREVRRC